MDQYVHAFVDQGLAQVPGVLAEPTLSHWHAAVAHTTARGRASPQAHQTRCTSRTTQETDTWVVSYIFDPAPYALMFVEVFDHPWVRAFVRAVLGEQLRFWTAHVLWDTSLVDCDLTWHKDNRETARSTPNGRITQVQFSLCLTDDHFQVTPSSHRQPLTEAEHTTAETIDTSPLPDEHSIGYEPGDILLMNHHASHCGSDAAGRTLMESTIAWDDAQPLPLTETLRRPPASRDIKRHETRAVGITQ